MGGCGSCEGVSLRRLSVGGGAAQAGVESYISVVVLDRLEVDFYGGYLRLVGGFGWELRCERADGSLPSVYGGDYEEWRRVRGWEVVE